MIVFTRNYNAIRRVASPCAAYRAATAITPQAGKRSRRAASIAATWAVALVLTLGLGALAGHESTASAQVATTAPV